MTRSAVRAGRGYNSDWYLMVRAPPGSARLRPQPVCYFITGMKYLIFRAIITSIRFFQGDDRHA
ncbi:protein of unknown function [Cupriavidus taiwanensis]|nr:protein of unknown function [Cupriavidus taiwanensis]